MSDRKDTVVVGVGNLLMSDEGVGVRLLQAVEESAGAVDDVDFAEAGSALMPIVHAIAGRKKAIILDCAFMGEEPGAILRFKPEQIRSVKDLPGLSLHEGDVMGALALSDSLGEIPREVIVFGVQPVTVEAGESLSDTLKCRFSEYVEAVLKELGCTS